MKKLIRFIALLALGVGIVSALPSGKTESAEEEPQQAIVDDTRDATSSESVLVDNDYIKSTYIDTYTVPGVDGVFYVSIKTDNMTGKEVVIRLDKASVNGEMIPIVSTGFPPIAEPDKSVKAAYIFPFEPLSISTIDEINQIEFDIVVTDWDNLSEIARVPSVIIEP